MKIEKVKRKPWNISIYANLTWVPIALLLLLGVQFDLQNINFSQYLIYFSSSLLLILLFRSHLGILRTSFPHLISINQIFIEKKTPVIAFFILSCKFSFYAILIILISFNIAPFIGSILRLIFSFSFPVYFIFPSVILITGLIPFKKKNNGILSFLFIILSLVLLFFLGGNDRNINHHFQPITIIIFLFLLSEHISGKLIKKQKIIISKLLILIPVILLFSFIFFFNGRFLSFTSSLTDLSLNYTISAGIYILLGFIAIRFFQNKLSSTFYQCVWSGFIKNSILKYSNILITLFTLLISIIIYLISPESNSLIIKILFTVFLLYINFINSAGFYITRREKTKLKIYQKAFYPVLPLLSVFGLLILTFYVGNILFLLIFSVIISSVYFLYTRKIFLKSGYKENFLTKILDQDRKDFRILIPLANPETAKILIKIAQFITKENDGELITLRVESSAQKYSVLKSNREIEIILNSEIDKNEIHHIDLTRKTTDVVDGILDTITDEKIDLVVLGWAEQDEIISPTLKEILEKATCDVLIIKTGTSSLEQMNCILMPWDENNEPPWYYLAETMKKTFHIKIKYLTVQKGRYYKYNSDFISKEIAKNVDEKTLVIIGNPPGGIFQKLSLGNVSLNLAKKTDCTVFISRPFPGMIKHWLRNIVITLDNLLPSVKENERSKFYSSLASGSRPNFDYYIMVALSSAIATLGLLLNSPAVIIGAMLVAPLMTPILALSLGIATGQKNILFRSFEAMMKGMFLAVGISIIITLIFPSEHLGVEVLSRTEPKILDLLIAIASGIAGAYAMAHGKVRAALPGVAIAAALMPPVCTIGICIARALPMAAEGALLLFTVNLIGISFAAGFVLLFLGLHPEKKEHYIKTTRTILSAFVTVLSLGLILFFIGRSSHLEAQMETKISSILQENISKGNYELISIDCDRLGHDTIMISATIAGEIEPDKELLKDIEKNIEREENKPIKLNLLFIKKITSE